jgi:hypothetical protein
VCLEQELNGGDHKHGATPVKVVKRLGNIPGNGDQADSSIVAQRLFSTSVDCRFCQQRRRLRRSHVLNNHVRKDTSPRSTASCDKTLNVTDFYSENVTHVEFH